MKPGYKQTEVGVIPKDWRPTRIGDIASFSGGSQPPRSTFKFQSAKGYVRLIQIRDYKSDEFETYVPEATVRKRCTSEDIMIGRYGPPIFQILRGIEGAYNVALIKASPTRDIERSYFYYILRQDSLFHLIDSLSRRSSGQTGVEMPALKAYGFGLPLPEEQRAIAEALGDADALIESLERLIAKKRAIQQGTMQELLTARRRLPGFSQPWTTSLIGRLATIKKGEQLHSSESAVDGPYPHLNGGMDPSGYTHKMNAAANTIAISEGGNSCGYVQFVDRPFWSGGHCYTVIPDQIDNHFLYHSLKGQQSILMGLRVGSGLPNVQKSALEAARLSMPTDPDEQTAIAAVLSGMDSEVAALEGKLAKARAIKQGLMQELLTGRIRLV